MDKNSVGGQRKKKPNKYHLKVIDFSIWNGIKFGFGFIIGTTIGTIALTLAGILLAFLLTLILGSMGRPI